MTRPRLAVSAVLALAPLCCVSFNPVQRIRKDFLALTVRVSPRHLMRPRTEQGRRECAAILKSIKNSTANGMFVVDAFAAAATQYSSDAETAASGGVLGEMIQQGVIRSKALDRACFTANLGEVEGPVESEYGWHLVLTPERINCKKDNGYVRIEPRTDGISTPKYIREDNTELAMQGEALGKTVQTVAFWALSCGFIAEGAALVGNSLPLS